jgi:hypothetical protein
VRHNGFSEPRYRSCPGAAFCVPIFDHGLFFWTRLTKSQLLRSIGLVPIPFTFGLHRQSTQTAFLRRLFSSEMSIKCLILRVVGAPGLEPGTR